MSIKTCWPHTRNWRENFRSSICSAHNKPFLIASNWFLIDNTITIWTKQLSAINREQHVTRTFVNQNPNKFSHRRNAGKTWWRFVLFSWSLINLQSQKKKRWVRSPIILHNIHKSTVTEGASRRWFFDISGNYTSYVVRLKIYRGFYEYKLIYQSHYTRSAHKGGTFHSSLILLPFLLCNLQFILESWCEKRNEQQEDYRKSFASCGLYLILK